MKKATKSKQKSSKNFKETEPHSHGKIQTISSMFQRASTRLNSDRSDIREKQKSSSQTEEDDDIVIVEVEETHSSYFNVKEPSGSSSGHTSTQSPLKRLGVSNDFKPKKRSKLSLSRGESVSKQDNQYAADNTIIVKEEIKSTACLEKEASDLLSHVGSKETSPVLVKQHKEHNRRGGLGGNESFPNPKNEDDMFKMHHLDDHKNSEKGTNRSNDKKDVDADLSGTGTPNTAEMIDQNTNKNSSSNAKDEIVNNNEIEGSGNEEKQEFTEPYYFNNFETVLTTVLQDESNVHLFNDEDRSIIGKYHSLSDSAKKIYIRLFSRRLQWIPLTKMNYPEISKDLKPYLDELVDNLFAYNENNLSDLQTVLEALSAPDVKTLAKVYHVSSNITQKGQQVMELVKQTQRTNISHMFGSSGGGGGLAHSMMIRAKKFLSGVYKLSELPRALFVRVMMLFSVVNTSLDEDSGSGGQGQLFHMLMVNMGKIVYPEFQIVKTHSIFGCRADVLRFSEALQLESDFLHATEKGKWDEAYDVFLAVQEKQKALEADQEIVSWNKNLPDYLRAFTATSVVYRLLSQSIEVLQRRKDFTGAVDLLKLLLGQQNYCCTHRGYWWERLALNLDAHLKKPDQSLEAAMSGLADPRVRVGHRLALYLRGKGICERPRLKLSHRLKECQHPHVKDLPKVYLEGRVLHSTTGAGPRFLTQASYRGGEDGEGAGDLAVCGVEEFVLDHYRTNGFPSGIHAEGSVVSSLFALFCWDILFLPKPDAFHSPYQAMPLDLYTDEFYDRRKAEIDERMENLSNKSVEELQAIAEETWITHEGVACTGMGWERMRSTDCVKELVACMGPLVLTGILTRYAHSPRHTRSGFPDLTLWNPVTGAFKICEVKGPGDRLSNKQILWLDYLLAVAAKRLMPSS
ncbi:fanconi-associated nuclease 1-like [Elysia marginata]|uniref:Fanconi-associated nuclease n=1 Tax=Elysia marginata TaxID=1093978 RepID=A0AAV4ITE0_9GAST|nr:fanconi-associated nuclease 1-like [Elysia marginata]